MWWSFIELLIFPPGGVLLVLLAGLLIPARRTGRFLIAGATVLLYLASAPAVSGWLMASLQTTPVLTPDSPRAHNAEAIVVLAGGGNPKAPEYGGITVRDKTLERIRFGARLQRATGLPLLVTGGDPSHLGRSEASLMERSLTEDFGVPVRWVEGHSRNTEENARYSRALLDEAEVDRIVLVTAASHMPRALDSFRRAGFRSILPAPTSFVEERPSGYRAWLPRAEAVPVTRAALHEYMGRLWYRIRYGASPVS